MVERGFARRGSIYRSVFREDRHRVQSCHLIRQPYPHVGCIRRDLIFNVADTVSTEARAFSNAGHAGLDFWTPNINPFKDPRWGRGTETPGEDPVRLKGYVKHLLAGLEGNNTKTRKVIATCKHYAAYDLERWKGVIRYGFNAIVPMQDLSEYYLPTFQQCARDSKVGSIMCSYNALNGTPACANSYLMTDILRKHWNWTEDNNYITSDCNAIQDFLPSNHNFRRTAAQAAAAAYNAGTDTVCEVGKYPPLTDVAGAYKQSLLSEQTIDNALRRLYEGLIRAGYFDPSSADPYRSISWSEVNTPKAQELALQSAADGIVLLKNDGTLPLNLQGKSVALIGHWANATSMLLGGYSGIPPYYHNPLYAAQQLGLTYHYATGLVAQLNNARDNWTTLALEAASKADVILYFGGNDLTIEAEDKDRVSIAWPEAQLTLLSRLSTLGKPLVVAELGSPNDDSPLLSNKGINAVLWAGFPGQSGGTAVFDVLTGKTAPAGRLPVTMYPASYVDAVPMTDMTLRPSPHNPGRTYRWFNSSVLPFGHGLSYTTFTASLGSSTLTNKTISTKSLLTNCDQTLYPHPDLCPINDALPVTVTNTGNRTSDYVALAFLAGEYGPKPYPIKSLASYGRVRGVKPGATVTARLPPLTLGTLARVDRNGNTVLYPGKYRLMIDVPSQTQVEFEVTGDEIVLDQFPQPK